MNLNKFLLISIKILLFLTALTPLIVISTSGFPFILGKIVFFRVIVEIALILCLIYLLFSLYESRQQISTSFGKFQQVSANIIKNPLFIFTCLFVISLIISTIFAVDSYRAFWGTISRGEGLFGMFHCFALLIMALFIFNKKDWLNFFKIYLAVGFILIFYAFLQYFGIRNFPFALLSEARPGSFLGNSAFFATHLFFLIIFAVIVFFETFKLKNLQTYKLTLWRYFSLVMILSAVITIFLTGTRGAILGFGVGLFFLLIYFSIYGGSNSIARLNLKKLAIILILIMAVFGGVFWFTKDNVFWQKIPGFNRLAQTAVLNVNDPSTQTRLITWKLSWNAFKEKPLFGWGPDNYLMAYEKYYDPEFAIYGETWLDRAHNKIFDLLVMQGAFGLFAYLGIFAVLVYKLLSNASLKFKSSQEKNLQTYKLINLQTAAPFLMALLVSYFVQNLVLFDQLNSNIAFFVLLGFLISQTQINTEEERIYTDNKSVSVRQNPYKSVFIKLLSTVVVIAASGFLGYSVYAFNYVPLAQAKAFQESRSLTENVEAAVQKLKEGMYPYNFAQYSLRSSVIDEYYMGYFFYNSYFFENSKYKPIADLLIEAMDEVVKREPFDARVMIREVEMLNSTTKTMDEKGAASLFKKAEALMREAVKRAPNRQEVYYHLAFNLAGQKRYDESIAEARYVVSLNPEVSRSHYHLALVLALAGRNEEALKELEIVEKITLDFKEFMATDMDSIMLIYSSQRRMDKIAELIIKSLDGRISPRVFKRQYYEAALVYFIYQEDSEHSLLIANYLATIKEFKDDMEVLIDLIQNGNWLIIHNTLGI